MSAREHIETNRLLTGLLDAEFDKLITDSPETLVQIQILKTLQLILFQLELITESSIDGEEL